MQSTAKMRPAPCSLALAIANWPTGPQPKIATVSPGLIRRDPRQVRGREYVREQDRLLVAHAVGKAHEVSRSVRNARVLGLQSVEAAALLSAAVAGCRRAVLSVGDVALRLVAARQCEQ